MTAKKDCIYSVFMAIAMAGLMIWQAYDHNTVWAVIDWFCLMYWFYQINKFYVQFKKEKDA